MSKKKRNDWILIGALLVLGISAIFCVEGYKKANTKNGEAVVFVDGKEIGRYPLKEDTTVLIEGKTGTNLLVIEDGKAFIKEADCPDKICVYHGKIDKNKETIVCLPNKVVVEIQNGQDNEIDISTN